MLMQRDATARANATLTEGTPNRLRVVECRDHVRKLACFTAESGRAACQSGHPRHPPRRGAPVGFSDAIGTRRFRSSPVEAMLTDTIARQISRRGHLARPRVEALTQMH
jgi:hypothetical protein